MMRRSAFGQSGKQGIFFAGLVALLGALSLPARAADLRTFDDANLHAVQFIDEFEGWAVGDQGTIWHTMDSGKTWDRQPAATRATLTDVCMQDYRVGYVVGRESLAFNPGSTGTVLWTREGGGRWHLQSRQFLPGLQQIHFDNADNGWVLGETSIANSTGVLRSKDGGKQWNRLQGPRVAGPLAGAAIAPGKSIVVGVDGYAALMQQGAIKAFNVNWLSGTAIRDVGSDGTTTCLVGDQGQLRLSQDGGKTWNAPRLPIPVEAQRSWDFHSVSVVNGHIWVIGRPGSVVLHSWDSGKSWKIQRTGQPLPMNALAFADTRHGWAVGDMGTILATTDGGETWTVQRQGGKRAAMLWMVSNARRIPLSVVARYGGNEGQHNVAFCLNQPESDIDRQGVNTRTFRWEDALRAVGGTVCETTPRFPLDDSRVFDPMNSLVARWDRLFDGNSSQEIERELVLAMRIWQPGIVITDSTVPSTDNPTAAAMTALGVQKAFQSAGDELSFPEQLAFFDLKPYQPTVLYEQNARAGKADVTHRSNEVGLYLGETFADTADAGMAMVWEEYCATEANATFTEIAAQQGDLARRPRDLLPKAIRNDQDAGMHRKLTPVDPENEELARKLAEKKRNLLALNRATAAGVGPDKLLAHLGNETKDMNPIQAGQVLFQIAQQAVAEGNWQQAATMFEYFLTEYPESPLALEAHRWLIAYSVSSEAQKLARTPTVVGAHEVRFLKPAGDGVTQVMVGGELASLREAGSEKKASEAAIQHGVRLESTCRHLWFDSRIQLCLAAAYTKLGWLPMRNAHLDNLISNDPNSRWKNTVALEKWFFERESVPPVPMAWSVYTDSKPYLDGKFDDECWKSLKGTVLKSGNDAIDKEYRTEVILRHDDHFLYVAATCRFNNPSERLDKVERISHDADLSGSDRVELVIDLDRDYNTYYRLGVDQRGQVADDFWGYKGWNPQWFVATESTDNGWQMEAAIPLPELTDDTNLTHKTWAFNVMRVIPGKAVLSWSQPAAADVRPEGFTFLQFVRRAKKSVDTPIRAN